MTQHIEVLLERDFGATQTMLTNHIQERTVGLFEANRSIHNVARVIGSVLDKNLLSSSAIENNVKYLLFCKTICVNLKDKLMKLFSTFRFPHVCSWH